MKKSALYLLCCFIVCFISSCGEEEKPTEIKENTPVDNTIVLNQEENVIYLEGIYATSTKVPHKENSINNIFDANSTTHWTTMKGAGPDEGFMLYFKNPEYISKIKLSQVTGAEFSEISEITLYGNGQKLGNFDINNPIALDKELKSLFIKIKDVKDLKVENNKGNSDYDDEYEKYSITSFDKNLSIGLSKIEIFGKKELLNIKPLHQVDGEVIASSILSPEIAYHPALLFDSRKEMVWAEGNEETSGINETLNFKFDKDIVITGIEIWNGYHRSSKHFEANARVKQFEFGVVDGNGKTENYSMLDNTDPQHIKLKEPITGKDFSLKITEIFSGKKYQDLVISEIRLYSNGVPFIIKTAFEEENSNANIEKFKGTVLENVIDKRINNNYSEEINGSSFNRSLIIRSNNTFVMYDSKFNTSQSDKDTLELVADGNWELIKQDDNSAKIRVFGKYASLTDDYGFYKGKGKASYHKIFQDFVTISNESIEGEKFIEKLLLKF